MEEWTEIVPWFWCSVTELSSKEEIWFPLIRGTRRHGRHLHSSWPHSVGVQFIAFMSLCRRSVIVGPCSDPDRPLLMLSIFDGSDNARFQYVQNLQTGHNSAKGHTAQEGTRTRTTTRRTSNCGTSRDMDREKATDPKWEFRGWNCDVIIII